MTIMESQPALCDEQSQTEAVLSIPRPLGESEVDVLLEAAVAAGRALEAPTRLNPAIEGLGDIETLDTWGVTLSEGANPRSRSDYRIELGGCAYFTRVTEADPAAIADPDAVPTIIFLHGLTEMIEAGTGAALHDDTAALFPGSKCISIATDGVGINCDTVSWSEGWKKKFPEMAKARHRLIRAQAANGPLTFVIVSMSSHIAPEILNYNLALQNDEVSFGEDEIPDEPFEVEAVINHSHAQAAKLSALVNMGIRFTGHIVRNGRKMVKEHPEKLPVLHEPVPGLRRSTPAIAGNIWQLMHGITWKRVSQTFGEYPTGYLSGAEDVLKQQKKLELAMKAFPGMVQAYFIPDRGHAACLDSKEAAAAIEAQYIALTGKASHLGFDILNDVA